MTRFVLYLVAIIGLSAKPILAQRFDPRLEHQMFSDPELVPMQVKARPADDVKPLWIRALSRDEPELQRMVADNIVRASRLGMTDWAEAVDRLVELVSQPEVPITVRRSCARALVQLDAQSAADALWQACQGSSFGLQLVIEPALARWKYAKAVPVWIQRIEEENTPAFSVRLASDALSVVGEPKAIDSLMKIVQRPTAPANLRLSVARAVAKIDSSGQLNSSTTLAKSELVHERLLAVALQQSASGPESIALLEQLAADSEATVAGAALERLFDIRPSLVDPFVSEGHSSLDPKIRRVCAGALVSQQSTESIDLLVTMLDDDHPGIRRYVSKSLIEAAGTSEQLTAKIVESVSDTISSPDWKTKEQCLIILGSLDVEDASSVILDFLEDPVPEVGNAAAWALGQIALPETYPVLLEYANEQHALILKDGLSQKSIDYRVAQILQLLGRESYDKADSLMREMVKKVPETTFLNCRAAAIWSLGLLHQDQNPEDLGAQLEERLNDVQSLQAESHLARRMSALSMGRFRYQQGLTSLKMYMSELDPVGVACRWSIERIQGEELPKSPPRFRTAIQWSLKPLPKGK